MEQTGIRMECDDLNTAHYHQQQEYSPSHWIPPPQHNYQQPQQNFQYQQLQPNFQLHQQPTQHHQQQLQPPQPYSVPEQQQHQQQQSTEEELLESHIKTFHDLLLQPHLVATYNNTKATLRGVINSNILEVFAAERAIEAHKLRAASAVTLLEQQQQQKQ